MIIYILYLKSCQSIWQGTLLENIEIKCFVLSFDKKKICICKRRRYTRNYQSMYSNELH